MIELLKSYFTKDGRKVVVLEYRGGKYLCSDKIGNKFFLSSSELLLSKSKPKIIEPVYSDNKVSFSEEEFDFNKPTEIEPEVQEVIPQVEKNFEEGAEFVDFIKIPEPEPESEPEEDIFDDEKPKKTEVQEDDFYGDLL
jgi:hypothetical protein